jgi:hypothetical protein
LQEASVRRSRWGSRDAWRLDAIRAGRGLRLALLVDGTSAASSSGHPTRDRVQLKGDMCVVGGWALGQVSLGAPVNQ